MEMEQLVSRIADEILKKLSAEGTSIPMAAANGIAGMIDHTLLKQDASEEQIRKLCQEARDNSFCSVCVNP